MGKRLTERDLDRAIAQRCTPLTTHDGGRRIDTHVEFKPVGKVKSDVCCNGNCSQAHECPRYQPANDDPPTFTWEWLIGIVIGLCVVGYLFHVGAWQWQ